MLLVDMSLKLVATNLFLAARAFLPVFMHTISWVSSKSGVSCPDMVLHVFHIWVSFVTDDIFFPTCYTLYRAVMFLLYVLAIGL